MVIARVPALPAARTTARRVGRYELILPLGHGTMAGVHLARSVGDAGFERLVALKLLHRDLCADHDLVERFLDEARVAAPLHHPNAAAVVDVGLDGAQPYMVMEYVEGDTLHAVQRTAISLGRGVPLGVALRVVLDALSGLDAAHALRTPDGDALGIIHRDVRPQNVLVGVDGVARLVDFGTARAATRPRMTVIGEVRGDVSFMAPEQLRGRSYDRRADVFAMGVTLWETLALRRCFPERRGALLSQLAGERHRPLREFAPHLPPVIDEVLGRALAPDPADRFEGAADFATALEDAFGAEVATQRELAQFMSSVASAKVEREREAVRASSKPLPDRAEVAAPELPTMKLQALPSRPPTFGARATLRPARASRRPLPATGHDEPTRPLAALRSRPPVALLPSPTRRRWFNSLVLRFWPSRSR